MAKKGKKKGETNSKKNDEATKQSKADLPPLDFFQEPPSMIAERMLNEGVIIWRRNSMGVRVQQLQNDKFYPVVDLLQLNTSLEDPMSNLLELNKKWNPIGEMLDNALDWFSQCLSFVAIDEATEQVCGTLIGRIMYSDIAREEIEELKRRAELEVNEEEGQKLLLKLKGEKEEKRKGLNEKKVLSTRVRSKATAVPPPPSLIRKKKLSQVVDDDEYDFALLKERTRASDNPSAVYKSAAIINRTETVKKNDESMNTIDELIVPDDDETEETDKKLKTDVHAKDKDKIEEKEIQVFEPPVDIIPIEVKPSPPTYVFDDTYEDYKDETLRHFMKIRYKLFHHYNLLKASEGLCYYKIYIWSVSQPFQNRGIGSDLLDAAEEMCYQLEIPMMAVICTSKKSQRIANRADFVPITLLRYKTMIGKELEDEKIAVTQIKYLDVPILPSYLEVIQEEITGEKEEKKPKKKESKKQKEKEGKKQKEKRNKNEKENKKHKK